VVTEVCVTEAIECGEVVVFVGPRATAQRRVYAAKFVRLRRLVTRPADRR